MSRARSHEGPADAWATTRPGDGRGDGRAGGAGGRATSAFAALALATCTCFAVLSTASALRATGLPSPARITIRLTRARAVGSCRAAFRSDIAALTRG